MTLSYIIPLYNGEKTILKCLDSIFTSGVDVEEFEVIVVDDCSTDNSVGIVKQYALSHPNIRVIQHLINKKQGGAKNTGIKAACGKYIAFADQDDEIVSDRQGEVLVIAKTQDADMISFEWIEIRDGKSQIRFDRNMDGKSFSGVGFCETVFNPSDSLAPWSYLYRREYLMEQNRFYAEDVLMEDADWIAWHLIHSKKVFRVGMPIYKWIRNAQSITSSTSWQFKSDYVLFGLRKIEDTKKYHALSSKFARIMYDDGVYNIESSLRTLWKADDYKLFFERINSRSNSLKEMKWSCRTTCIIHHPKLSCFFLSLVGHY